MCGSAYDMTVNMTGPEYSDESAVTLEKFVYDYVVRLTSPALEIARRVET